MAYWNRELQRIHSPLLRYIFALVSVAAALGISFAAQHYGFRDIELPVLTVAIALTTWYAGAGPSLLTVLLSSVCFDYFFIEPLYSLEVSTRDLPYFLIFIVWAGVVASFSEVRRRIEDSLRLARDNLQLEVEQRRLREDEIRQLNRELGRRATELEASNNELESFAYSVSHDLRAPLRHMDGYLTLLSKRSYSMLDNPAKHYVDCALEASQRMGTLIDELLQFSRLGRAEMQKVPVDLNAIVVQMRRELEPATRGRTIQWHLNPLPKVAADTGMMRQVIENLLANAIKFTRNCATADIEIGSRTAANDEVVLFVRDNGAGFDMRYYEKLFQVFQRLHGEQEFEGTGIGLANVRRVVERHGGRVWAEGAVGVGATFYFSLPHEDRPQGESNALTESHLAG